MRSSARPAPPRATTRCDRNPWLAVCTADLIEGEGRIVSNIIRAFDQARCMDDLHESHVEPFHHAPGGLVVSLGESNDFSKTQHVEAELETSRANLCRESLATHPIAKGPTELCSTLVIDHGKTEASSSDERSVRSTVSDPLAHVVPRPPPTHLDGEATGVRFRPCARIPVSHVRIGMQLDQLVYVLWSDRRQGQPVGRHVHDQQYGAFRVGAAAVHKDTRRRPGDPIDTGRDETACPAEDQIRAKGAGHEHGCVGLYEMPGVEQVLLE